MIEHLLFGLSAALLIVATNLDNFAAMLALSLAIGARRAAAGFAIAQGVILVLATGTAMGAGLAPNWTGYLGVVPLLLGSYALWQQMRDHPQRPRDLLGTKGSTLAATMLFLSMSMDSFAAMTPYLADAQPGLRLSGVLGAASAIGALALAGLIGSRATERLTSLTEKLEKIAPVVMILAGLYVLANTPSDLI